MDPAMRPGFRGAPSRRFCVSTSEHIHAIKRDPDGAFMQYPQSPMSTLVPIIIVFAIFLLRARRMAVARPMSLYALWRRPVILCLVAGYFIYNAPPQGALQDLILVATLAAGAAAGWYQ